MAGICLRGLPGWGQVFAPLTTVVNTFGGTWFTEDWKAQVDGEEFKEATQFYVDLVREHGESGAAQAGFTECLNNLQQGNAAMWYDATSAAGSLEAEDSPVKGKLGYAPAPVVETDSSGWLYAWSWAHPEGQLEEGRRLEVHLLGLQQATTRSSSASELGWPQVPAGKRASTYDNPDYLAVGQGVRRADAIGHRGGRPARTPACSRGRHRASSSSASPTSPTSAPPSPSSSARRSPGR